MPVCVRSTFLPCDQFNGNLIYLKKKETQIVTVKLIKAVYFYFKIGHMKK